MSTDDDASPPERLDAGDFELRRMQSVYVGPALEAIEESLEELRPWMSWAQELPSAAAMETVLTEADLSFRSNKEWTYLLFDRENGKVVGGAGLHRRIGPRGLEIGYWIRTSFTGRGLATTTARVLTDAAFDHFEWVDRVEIRMDAANGASAAVPRKLGFTLVREEERPRVTPGHTGRGLLWSVDRSTWIDRSP
jgi:RimJ/RimL family protein N-acetyltransferase